MRARRRVMATGPRALASSAGRRPGREPAGRPVGADRSGWSGHRSGRSGRSGWSAGPVPRSALVWLVGLAGLVWASVWSLCLPWLLVWLAWWGLWSCWVGSVTGSSWLGAGWERGRPARGAAAWTGRGLCLARNHLCRRGRGLGGGVRPRWGRQGGGVAQADRGGEGGCCEGDADEAEEADREQAQQHAGDA